LVSSCDPKETRGATVFKKTVGVAIIACCGALGCGGSLSDEPERVLVSGSVTYAGQPVADGEVRFVPTKGTEAPSCSAVISGGVFKAEFKGGVPVGVHRVEIRAYRPREGAGSEEVPGMAQGETVKDQYLPAKYNSKSELELTVESGSGPITKDFALEE